MNNCTFIHDGELLTLLVFFSDTVDEDDDLYDFVEDEENEGDDIYEDLMRREEQPETVRGTQNSFCFFPANFLQPPTFILQHSLQRCLLLQQITATLPDNFRSITADTKTENPQNFINYVLPACRPAQPM